MREEEKLARDVYLTFSQWYPGVQAFRSISESEHTRIPCELAQYGVPDPEPATNDVPASVGVFAGAAYGPHMAGTFTALTAQGAQGQLAALYVCALIEELDCTTS